MQYTSRRDGFLADMVQQKKVKDCERLLLGWRVVFQTIRFWEGVEYSVLLTVTTEALTDVKQILYGLDNELAEVIPFPLIYNTAIILAAFSEIICERWRAKKDSLYLSQ